MAGRSKEEEYLESLLNNAYAQDAKFEEEEPVDTPTEDIVLENIDNTIEDSVDDSEFVLPGIHEEEEPVEEVIDEAISEESDIPDFDTNMTSDEEILNEEELSSLNDLIKSVQEENENITVNEDEDWSQQMSQDDISALLSSLQAEQAEDEDIFEEIPLDETNEQEPIIEAINSVDNPEISSIEEFEDITVDTIPDVEEPPIEEPAIEEMAIEEPAIEEPAIEELVAEEPAIEELVTEESVEDNYEVDEELSEQELENLLGDEDSDFLNSLKSVVEDVNEEKPQEEASEEFGDLSQDSIDSLLAGYTATDTEESGTEEFGELSQDSIDSLLAGFGSDNQEEEVTSSSDDFAGMSQEDIDRLLGSGDGMSDEDLDNILALDDDMSFSDIPSETDESLSQEELDRISAMEEEHLESDIDAEDLLTPTEEFDIQEDIEDLPDKKSKKKDKKNKDKKAKKEKKTKDKKKFSLKNFFVEEVDDQIESLDDNQALLDDLYNGTDSLSDADINDLPELKAKKPKKEKKPKKPKQPKPKKPKKVKAPKEKVPMEKPDPKAAAGVIITAIVVVAIVVVGTLVFSYLNSVKSAKKEYEAGNYSAAYEYLDGKKLIRDEDKELYNKLRSIMQVNQHLDSYKIYLKHGDKVMALDSLVNAVGRKNTLAAEAEKNGATLEVDKVYAKILEELGQYGITEQMAFDLYSISDYDTYVIKLKAFGGATNDSNN